MAGVFAPQSAGAYPPQQQQYNPAQLASYTPQPRFLDQPPQSPTPANAINDNIAGIGIHFTPNVEGMHIVTGMRPGGPAESCGRILVGDILWKVDDTIVKGLAIQQVIKMLTGTPESTVTLSVLDGKFPYLPAKLCQCQDFTSTLTAC